MSFKSGLKTITVVRKMEGYNVRFAEFIEIEWNLSEIVTIGDCCGAEEFQKEINKHSF